MKEHMTEKQLETVKKIVGDLVHKKVISNTDDVEVIVTLQDTETKGKCVVWLHLPKQPVHPEVWGTIFEDGAYLTGRAVKEKGVRYPWKKYNISELTEV